jgi:hypothetical protein
MMKCPHKSGWRYRHLTVSLLRHVYKLAGTAKAQTLMIHDVEKPPATFYSMLHVRTEQDLLRISV